MTDLGSFWQQYNEMPRTATFDELIASPSFHNYHEYWGRWKVVLANGCIYIQDKDDPDIGNLCGPLQVLDKCGLANWGAR